MNGNDLECIQHFPYSGNGTQYEMMLSSARSNPARVVLHVTIVYETPEERACLPQDCPRVLWHGRRPWWTGGRWVGTLAPSPTSPSRSIDSTGNDTQTAEGCQQPGIRLWPGTDTRRSHKSVSNLESHPAVRGSLSQSQLCGFKFRGGGTHVFSPTLRTKPHSWRKIPRTRRWHSSSSPA